jgi:hypothetical protein
LIQVSLGVRLRAAIDDSKRAIDIMHARETPAIHADLSFPIGANRGLVAIRFPKKRSRDVFWVNTPRS